MSMYDIILAKFALIMKKLAQVNASEQKVYNAGYEKGKAEGGYEQGVADGKQAEYDAFWDAFQENGNRTNYSLAFSGKTWVDSIFKPKYAIKVTGYADYLFSQTGITDIKGVSLDTSGATTLANALYMASITHLPIIDCSGVNRGGGMQSLISNCTNLVSIEKIIMPDPTLISHYASFLAGCSKLENVVIEGVIGKGSLDMKASTKLSHDSIVSIINALSTATSGLSITLSKTAKEAAFTADEWAALIATKPNWTINLV